MFWEILVKYMVSMENVDETLIAHDRSHNNRIKLLKKEYLIPKDIESIPHTIRLKRNDATHSGYDNVEKAIVLFHTLMALDYLIFEWAELAIE